MRRSESSVDQKNGRSKDYVPDLHAQGSGWPLLLLLSGCGRIADIHFLRGFTSSWSFLCQADIQFYSLPESVQIDFPKVFIEEECRKARKHRKTSSVGRERIKQGKVTTEPTVILGELF